MMGYLNSLVLVVVAALTTPAFARAPLPRDLVANGLAEIDTLAPAPALARLVALAAHRDALPPRDFIAALERIARDAPPLVAARARFELAALTGGSDGDPTARTSALAVAVLAPDAEIVALHRGLAALGAARAQDAYDPDARQHRWQATIPAAGGLVPLDELIAGRGLVLQVTVPIDTAAPYDGVLRLGATGDLAVSLASGTTEGRALGVVRGLSRAEPDQLELPLKLAPGRQVLLVTLRPNADEQAMLRLRFDPPLTSESRAARTQWDPAQEVRWRPFDPGEHLPGIPWNPAVRALLSSGAPGPRLQGLVLARMLGLPDLASRGRLEDRLATTTASGAPKPGALGHPGHTDFLLALDGVIRPEDRASLLLALLDRGRCRGCARDPLLLLALAEHTASRGQLVQAGALVAEAEAADGAGAQRELVTYMRACLARLAQAPEEVLIAYGLAAPGLTPADFVARAASLSERARHELAQAALELGRADVARALADDLGASYPARLDLTLTRVRMAQASGDARAAAALSLALARAHPERATLALRAAEQLRARGDNGDRGLARTLVMEARERLLWKTDGLVDAGHLLEALGEPGIASALYERALEVSPAHEDARRHLERLLGAEPAPLTLTLDDVVDAPIVDPDASFEVLGEEHVVRVQKDGSATHWIRRILRAQAVPDTREARTLVIPFDPTQQTVRVLDASVRRAAAGPVTSATLAEPVTERELESVSEDWYGLYYDLRRLSIPFDHLERGDVIEVTWRTDPVGQLFPGVLDLFEVLADRVPKHLHRVVVETPSGMTLRTKLTSPDGAVVDSRETRATLAAGGTRHVLEARAIGAVPYERLAPGTAEVSPVWQATTFATWREVATWYRRLIAPQRHMTPAMKDFVADASRDKATRGEILSRLAEHVTQQVRYVGLEFGIHGYKPYRTDQVWGRRFGDCKDKATLLTTLLNEAGIPAEVALVRTRKQGRLMGALPSLALFDHAAVYLRQRGELIDPTATHYGPEELPREDQGAQILVLMPPEEPVDLALSRVDPPARNGVAGTYSVTLGTRGDAGIQGVVAFNGTQAPPYRALLLDPASQRARLIELMNQRFPGLTLGNYRVSDPSDTSSPFELVFHAQVPRFGQLQAGPDGTLQVLRPTGIDGHRERFASEDARALPLVLGPPMSWDVTYVYVLPEGHRVRSLPADAEAAGPFGTYHVTWHDEGASVRVRTRLEYLVDQVPAGDYPSLRDFVRGFDAAVATPLVLGREPAVMGAPPVSHGSQ